MDFQDLHQDCTDKVREKFSISGDVERFVHSYKESIPISNDNDLPLGKLSGIFFSLEQIDSLCAELFSNAKSRIDQEQLSWLMTVRKGVAITYCIIGSLFQSESTVDEVMINGYFVQYNLRQSISIINAFVELLIHKAKEPKPELDKLLPSFSESGLDKLNDKLSIVMPGNEFSQKYQNSKKSLNEADLDVLLEMKQRCDEFLAHIKNMLELFRDIDSEVSLY
ncbi:MAG: hypothetical protein GY796_14785 [Chloroflexi bacterium]|nr:hypothetical protein [Chloroflexota bacterium]